MSAMCREGTFGRDDTLSFMPMVTVVYWAALADLLISEPIELVGNAIEKLRGSRVAAQLS